MKCKLRLSKHNSHSQEFQKQDKFTGELPARQLAQFYWKSLRTMQNLQIADCSDTTKVKFRVSNQIMAMLNAWLDKCLNGIELQWRTI